VGGLEGTQCIKTGPDGTIYVVFGDNSHGNSDARLIAVDPLTGALKWQFTPPLSGATTT
jgi:outer membrane protein assembly factor BamB